MNLHFVKLRNHNESNKKQVANPPANQYITATVLCAVTCANHFSRGEKRAASAYGVKYSIGK